MLPTVSNPPIQITDSVAIGHSSSVNLSAINLIRDRVLQIIRNKMPISILFTPELKINLSLFIKDQMLIHRIAQWILPLVGTSPLDASLVAKHFENSDLLLELKNLFKPVQLNILFEAAVDVLNGTLRTNQLEKALKGRIFTLNNALIAQTNPKAISQSQLQNNITQQDLFTIQNAGSSFIREMISLHLHTLNEKENVPFREHLKHCVEQLVLFTQQITCFYLTEHGKMCPSNPLTFRDSTGRNFNGRVSATVLEACLNALGFKTRLLARSDLEPRVNITPVHSIIEVIGTDGLHYMVDASYIQFFKDIYLDDEKLPTDPVLILEESEVDQYIKTNILVEWKSNFIKVKTNQALVDALHNKDQLLSYIINELALPVEVKPSCQETWVEKSFKRVWDLNTYLPVLANQGFQEIFYGVAEAHKTYDLIQSMGIAPLTHHRSNDEIEGLLKKLMQEPSLQRQNNPEALSLIAHLPRLKKGLYASLLDLDPRLQGKLAIDISLNTYFRSLKKIVNPFGKDLRAVYGCSGSDSTSILLATDAQELIFIDLTPLSFPDFEQALELLKREDAFTVAQNFPREDPFIEYRLRYMGGMSWYHGEGKHEMPCLATKFFIELKELGVNLNETQLTTIDRGLHIDFSWQYYGANNTRVRRITFLNCDITKPDGYPIHLKKLLQEGFDIFYMKGAFLVPQAYPQFLPHLAQSMHNGGWMMTVDKTITMDEISPESCLQQHGFVFDKHNSDEMCMFQELTLPPYDPLVGSYVLDFIPPERRKNRNSGTDLSYWSLLNLRQKKGIRERS